MPNRTPAQDVLHAARALRDVLSGLGDALEHGRLDGVLDAEPALGAAVASFAGARARLAPAVFDLASAAAVRHELDGVATALKRCAALGSALEDIARERCATTAYDASGQTIPVKVHGAVREQV